MLIHRSSRKPSAGVRLRTRTVLAVLALACPPAGAHIFIPQDRRAGAYPDYPGSGWRAEVFLNIPDESADHLIVAEQYIAGRTADFEFRTDWIDFPAGPTDSDLDANFATMGDFLNGHIYEISDPALLDAPFGNFLIRFTGYVNVRLEDENRPLTFIGLPVWVDFGSWGYDGYRTRVGGETCYVRYLTTMEEPGSTPQPWEQFGPSIELLGLYPIEINYFNRFDPSGAKNAERAGIEVYSWHGGGLAWPQGLNMVHPIFGPGTIVNPAVIYQAEDILPAQRGDFEGDADIDLGDLRWFQVCFQPPLGGPVFLPAGCDWLDMDLDGDVDWNDYEVMAQAVLGPQ